MNKLLASILICGFTLMVLMLLYPPWVLQSRGGDQYPMGYGFIWEPPARRVEVPGLETKWFDINLNEVKAANSIDLTRLLVQEVAVVIIVFGIATLLGKKQPQQSS